MGRKKQILQQAYGSVFFVVLLILFAVFSQSAKATPTYNSTTYGVDEVMIGTGGSNDMNSATYNGRATVGDTGVGNSSSTTYQAYGGFTTNADPYIEMTVTAATADLGVLSTSATATTTMTFTVRAYLANGYVVVNGSDPPTATSGIGSHALSALITPTASSAGTEQFGINLVANTSPTTFGADPVQLPNVTYSFGAAASGYNTANLYKYVKGDTIAYSSSSSGYTQYTISYIYNVSNTTQSGQYVFDHILIATATF